MLRRDGLPFVVFAPFNTLFSSSLAVVTQFASLSPLFLCYTLPLPHILYLYTHFFFSFIFPIAIFSFSVVCID
jgi:hypothetical protein